MAEGILHQVEALPLRLARWVDGNNVRRALVGALLLVTFSSTIMFGYINVTGDTSVTVRGDGNVIIVPREIGDVQPSDVACKGEKVVVSDGAQGLFYQAVYGKFVLSYTAPLDKVVLTDGKVVEYPPIDERTVQCLQKRAVKVQGSQ